MTDLQKEFEATGYTSWINADLYPDGKIYTQEYTQWLEKQVLALRQPPVMGSASRKPWNWGKRKPVTDDCGNKWCNCVEPKLTSNAGGRGQAFCLLCMTPWYH